MGSRRPGAAPDFVGAPAGRYDAATVSAREPQRTVSPVDGSVHVERELASVEDIDRALSAAVEAQRVWKATSLPERAALCGRLVDALIARSSELSREITLQMGRPIRDSPGEVRGLEERARYMINAAHVALADLEVGDKLDFRRFIRRTPLGVVFTVAPWNYPYLTSVNTIVPALMAGNSVLLKHSAQTPLCAEHYSRAASDAGLPDGVLQHVHASHDAVAGIIGDARVDFVAFTGSVEGGHAVVRAAAERFIGAGLELGGKDPAYVRADADLGHAVESLVDGAFYNAGQSCCGVERIYVQQDLFARFVDAYVAQVESYALGDPRELETTLGPMVRKSAADFVRDQIAQAVQGGARALIDRKKFPADDGQGAYHAPQVLIDVDHAMNVMMDESFGPVVGIMKVADDEEAVRLMNDSRYGLSASVWTADLDAAIALGERVETGTFFMNRCDYLDPALAWTGVKDSGRGCTLSTLGYEQLTRAKSFHLRYRT
jgi:acyl-CoA reductase-like NAD-dependent aldehyde dehydrogenase